MIIQRSFQVITGYYDFAVSGGAIGTIDLQVPTPTNFMFTQFAIFLKTAPTDGIADLATLSFDYIDKNNNTVSVGTFMVATTCAALVAAGPIILTIPTVANTIGMLADGGSVAMSIAVNPLTAGQIAFVMTGVQLDFH